MTEKREKDVELSEEEMRQAAGGRQTRQAQPLSEPILDYPAGGSGPRTRRHDGELDGQVDIQR